MAVTGILEFDVLLRPVKDQDSEPMTAGRIGVMVPLDGDADQIASDLAASVVQGMQGVTLQPPDPASA